ncbi:DEAD/DEAH box helicase [Delftia tsuruhatensis]|uniref:DEAD/DEAH box helicase n=1 Tax=Delftia tsuruhatensis TaxID=180282 RepID=UPI002260C942|nr:DEAD/DEAH box helicase [Delftia tsuruhatensis]MCX7507649.1 DEAD/DEAH box helicase [Delftia tsuruhatensis]
MSYADLRNTLSNRNNGSEFDPFKFLADLSAFTSLADEDDKLQEARDILIRVLEDSAKFKGYEAIIQTLLRNVGLFPYLDFKNVDAADQLAAEAHRPEAMPENIVFTAKQAEVYRELMAGRSVVLSAPTSFGKSLIIDAVIASNKYHSIVVVVPTLALVDETRRRLLKFRDRYKIITHLSQEPSERNIFVHTQERVVENSNIKDVDFFVIDEFYKLHIEDSAEGDERAVLLNHAFYKLAKRAKQFYMLGPSIHELPDGFGPNYRCLFIRTDFSTVASDSHLVPEGKDDISRLKTLVPNLEGPTLVFSGSVGGARKFGRAIAEARSEFSPKEALKQAIAWLSANYSPKWGLVSALSHGVGIHHGKLPRSIAQLLVRLFNGGFLDYLVCTSTLIEGVNTAARNVVVVDNKINKKKYDYFTFNNIRGRSGRMWQHYVGHVYLFNSPPDRELEFVDVPVFTQNESAPDALLVQLEQQDLSDDAKARVGKIWNQAVLSPQTIQQNVGIDPQGQIELAREIEARLQELMPLLCWTGQPTYDQTKEIFDLAWRHFKVKAGSGVRSASQLTLLVNRYRKNPDYAAQLSAAIAGKMGDEADEALESFLEFARQWLSFKAPRLVSAVGRIQGDVLLRHGIRPGNYAFFCTQLESLFMNPVVIALEEYGVPIQIASRLAPMLGDPKTLDEALAGLARRRPADFSGLTMFERVLISPLCARPAAQ